MAVLAFFLGALFLVRLIVVALRRTLLRNRNSKGVFARNLIAFVGATFISGFGRAHGGSPQFANAALAYLAPAGASFLWDALLAKRKAAGDRESLAH